MVQISFVSSAVSDTTAVVVVHLLKYLKGQFTLKSKIHTLPVELFISLDSFGVSCLVLEISAVDISAFF